MTTILMKNYSEKPKKDNKNYASTGVIKRKSMYQEYLEKDKEKQNKKNNIL